MSFLALKQEFEYRKDWALSRLKFVLQRNDGGVWGEEFDEDGMVVLRSTEIAIDGTWQIKDPAKRKLSMNEHQIGLLLEGDLLVTKSSGSEEHLGKTALVSKEVAKIKPAFSNFMQRLRLFPGHNPHYYYYFLNSYLSREYLSCLGNTTTGLRNLGGGLLAELAISGPPLSEQTQIARFLDYETAKIDALIDKQQQLIELLQEKRQAVISHAVTKGLNPDAPMKDSGVEWLGEVPAHWEVVALKHLVQTPIIDGPHETPKYATEGIPFVSAESLSEGFINFERIWGYISEEDHKKYSKRYLPRKGDILMVKLGATAGMVGIVDTNVQFNIWVPLAAIRLKSAAFPNFVIEVLRSENLKNAYQLSWTYGTQQTLGLRTISNLRIPLPPGEEQKKIFDNLQKISVKLEELTAKAAKSISLLQERRAALISAAVTGKIDVREWTEPEGVRDFE